MTPHKSPGNHGILPTLVDTLEDHFPGFTFPGFTLRADEVFITARRLGGVKLLIQLEMPRSAAWSPIDKVWSPIDKWGCKVLRDDVQLVPEAYSSDPVGLAVFSMRQAVAALRRIDDQPLLDRLNEVASRFAVGLASAGLSFDWWDVSTHRNPPHALRGGFDVADSDNVFEIELISKASGAWVCRIITGYYGSEDDDEDITSLIGEARSTDPIEAFQQAIDTAFRATHGAANVFRGLALGLRGVGG